VDNSRQSIERANATFGHVAQFKTGLEPSDAESCDVAYCNGVFHHIPPNERPSAVRDVFTAMRPGGWFALWENNPWNPGTRIIMSRIPFDRDAVLLWPGETRRLLRNAGFTISRTTYHFCFPSLLSVLRPLERFFTRVPFGGQYCVLGRKPPVQTSSSTAGHEQRRHPASS
jgi:SAM-dependent methyltransferase